MAEQTETREQNVTEGANGGSQPNGGHKGAFRVAAIAAATGATALAARKALSGRDQSGEGGQKSGGRRSFSGDDGMVGAMMASGWGAAKDSLQPFAEEAASAAGDWVGRNGPEYVRETLVPQFIRGFEKARKSSGESQ
jgi:hypothetical protein